MKKPVLVIMAAGMGSRYGGLKQIDPIDEQGHIIMDYSLFDAVRFGGQVSDVDEWGKKRLAYEIQKMNEGYYYFIHFDADTTVPAEMEARLRIMDNVLRYLCVKQEA